MSPCKRTLPASKEFLPKNPRFCPVSLIDYVRWGHAISEPSSRGGADSVSIVHLEFRGQMQ